MSDSNLPPIFAVTESATIDNNNDADDFDPSLMQSFKEEVLSSFDSISPRVTQLERTLSKAITTSQTLCDRSNYNFNDELNEVQLNMKEMHSHVIEMSRRVQSLSLTSQSSSALAVPRLLRPVNEEYCDFKSEFDSSLKNIATLSGKITEKSQTLSNSIESKRKLPSMISKIKKDISIYDQKIKENDRLINELSGKSSQMIEESERLICEEIDKQVSEAEKMLNEMEESAKKGQTESDAFSQKMQDDRESLRLSFTNLTQDIEKTTNDHLNELNTAIEESSKKSNSLIESIQNQLSDEFDQILKNFPNESETSIIDQINQANEEAQLLSLMNRLEKLQERIQNSKKSIQKDNNSFDKIEEEEEVIDDDDEEVFTRVIDGVTIKYYCKADGTFHT